MIVVNDVSGLKRNAKRKAISSKPQDKESQTLLTEKMRLQTILDDAKQRATRTFSAVSQEENYKTHLESRITSIIASIEDSATPKKERENLQSKLAAKKVEAGKADRRISQAWDKAINADSRLSEVRARHSPLWKPSLNLIPKNTLPMPKNRQNRHNPCLNNCLFPPRKFCGRKADLEILGQFATRARELAQRQATIYAGLQALIHSLADEISVMEQNPNTVQKDLREKRRAKSQKESKAARSKEILDQAKERADETMARMKEAAAIFYAYSRDPRTPPVQAVPKKVARQAISAEQRRLELAQASKGEQTRRTNAQLRRERQKAAKEAARSAGNVVVLRVKRTPTTPVSISSDPVSPNPMVV